MHLGNVKSSSLRALAGSLTFAAERSKEMVDEVVKPLVGGVFLSVMLLVLILLPFWNWSFLRISFKERWSMAIFTAIFVAPLVILATRIELDHRFWLFLVGDYVTMGAFTILAVRGGVLKFGESAT